MYKYDNYVEFLAKLNADGDAITMQIPFNSKFDDVIHALQKAFNKFELSYFEYLDDDNDNVIVSCEGDLQSVFLYYSDVMKKALNCGISPLPLQICAKSDIPERNPNLTIFLNGGTSPVERECNSNTSSSKSNAGSISGGMFIYTTTDDNIIQLAQSNVGTMSPMSADAHDTGHWSASPTLCEDNVYLLGEIGCGTTGRVMRALNIPTQEVIAIKIIDLDMDKEDTVKQQILSELTVLRVSKSRYIIEFYGAFFVENAIYICTEFMDGYSLDRYGIIDNDILSKLLVPMINGLVYLWSSKIIHRDVKPSNMLINTSGQVKLCDFGISKQLVHSIAKTYTGTVAFMSPERLQGDSYRLSSDVWSLGVSVFILGTGSHPFVDLTQPMTPALVMNSIYHSSGLTISSLSAAASSPLSPIMTDFITQCLQKDPSQRLNPSSILTHQIYLANCGNYVSELSQWVFDNSP